MTFEFEAALVVADPVAEALSFADQTEDHQHYLIIQRDDESSDNVSPDMENIYIERDDQQFGGYGGIESVQLSKNRLTLRLTPRMAKQMGHHEALSVGFSKDFNKQVDELVTLIFRGYESRIVRCQ